MFKSQDIFFVFHINCKEREGFFLRNPGEAPPGANM